MARWWQLAAVLVLVASTAATSMAQDAGLQTKCQDDLSKLSDCMDYATGHEATPSAKCCEDTGETQKARPQCLCYIIQQVHSGTHGVQNLGLRFDRLLAQPAACKLANANVSLCISMLYLPYLTYSFTHNTCFPCIFFGNFGVYAYESRDLLTSSSTTYIVLDINSMYFHFSWLY
jgi:hypothetical protein